MVLLGMSHLLLVYMHWEMTLFPKNWLNMRSAAPLCTGQLSDGSRSHNSQKKKTNVSFFFLSEVMSWKIRQFWRNPGLFIFYMASQRRTLSTLHLLITTLVRSMAVNLNSAISFPTETLLSLCNTCLQSCARFAVVSGVLCQLSKECLTFLDAVLLLPGLLRPDFLFSPTKYSRFSIVFSVSSHMRFLEIQLVFVCADIPCDMFYFYNSKLSTY